MTSVGRPFGDDCAAAAARAGADVDQPIGLPHHGFVVLDDEHACCRRPSRSRRASISR